MIKFLIVKGILRLGELMIVTFVLLPFALSVYTAVNVAFWGLDAYKWLKRVA